MSPSAFKVDLSDSDPERYEAFLSPPIASMNVEILSGVCECQSTCSCGRTIE